MLNVPNALTLLRIFAVPLFLSLLVEGEHQLACIVFIIAGLTDGIDGLIARVWDLRTELGAHLDPLADKLLVVSSFITLGILGAVPLPLMIIVLTRDVIILGGFLLTAALVGETMAMAPSKLGKMTTFTQLLSISLVLLTLADWWQVPKPALSAVFVVTGLVSLLSGAGYMIRGIRWYQASESEHS